MHAHRLIQSNLKDTNPGSKEAALVEWETWWRDEGELIMDAVSKFRLTVAHPQGSENARRSAFWIGCIVGVVSIFACLAGLVNLGGRFRVTFLAVEKFI